MYTSQDSRDFRQLCHDPSWQWSMDFRRLTQCRESSSELGSCDMWAAREQERQGSVSVLLPAESRG